jgi:YfiH family protein
MWLHAPNITSVHGFSTRNGGVSPAPFYSLNLGGSEDNESNISTNRTLALDKLQLKYSNLSFLKQVHGTDVLFAKCGKQEGDALVTNEKEKTLAISIADCYPILFEDKENGVIGAAHAGWRGTVGKIAEHTVNAMLKLGANKPAISVAIGQGICTERFEVGDEVRAAFLEAGFPHYCFNNKCIDLIACNKYVLLQNGILEENIWTMNRCTYESDFFSYRRDAGITGRMWAVIAMP